MVREKPKIIIVLIFLSFVYSMNSQTTISQDYYARFKHLTVADGLPASHITTLLQDNNLFIWIGTTKGLTRYDGHTFRKFFHHSNDSTSIPDNYVTCLKQDSVGNIWVGTKKGLAYYNEQKAQFVSIPLISESGRGISNNHIRAILPDSYPLLWVETVDGNLHLLNTKTFISKIYHHNRVGQPYYDYHSIFKDSYDKLWVGGRGLGPLYFNLHSKSFIQSTSVGKGSTKKRDHDVACYFEDSNHNFWVSGTDGFYLYDRLRDIFTKKLATSTFQIVEDNAKSLWLATGGGLYKYDIKKDHLTRFSHNESDPVSISNNHLYCVMIDKDGNVWTGTNDGVNILLKNQTYIRHYRQIPTLRNSLSDNDVTSFLELNDSIVYIGTNGGGLNRMNSETEKLEAFTTNTKGNCSISANRVSAIKGNSKQLWVGLWQGVGFNRFDINSKCFTRYAVSLNTLKKDWYNDFYDDGGDTLWCGIWGGHGIHFFDKKTGKFLSKNYQPRYHPDNSSLLKQYINGNFIITVNNFGILYIFDNRTNTFNGYISNKNKVFAKRYKLHTADIPKGIKRINSGITVNEVTLLAVDKGLIYFSGTDTSFHSVKQINYPCYAITSSIEKHSLWMGTERGLEYYDHEKRKTFLVEKNSKNESPLFEKKITSLHLNSRAQLLIGTESGLLTYNPVLSKFVSPPEQVKNSELAHSPIKEIKHLSDNKLYFLLKQGFAFSTPEFDSIQVLNVSNSFRLRMPTDIIFDVERCLNGNSILLATDIGIIKYSADNSVFSAIEMFKDYSVHSLKKVKNRLSVCTDKGYLQYIPASDSVIHFNYPPPDDLTSHLISFLRKDNNGFIWAGTTNRGVNRINPATGEISHYFEGGDKHFIGSDALCFLQTKSGQILTGGEKVNIYDESKDVFVKPDFADRLSNEPVLAMLEDDNSDIWFISENSIFRYNITDKTVTNIKKLLGLKNISFTKGALKLKSGEFLIGTKQGFLKFYPEKIKKVSSRSMVQITGVSVLGKHVDSNKKMAYGIKLNYDENFIEISYSSMSYSPVEVTYEYMLEGVDKDWVKTTNPSTAYTKIEPGNYLFKVRNADSPGKTLNTFSVRIRPPFWLTWWFILIVSIVLISLLVYWWKQRLKKLKVMENNLDLKQRLLLSQLNPHFIFNILTAIQSFIYQNNPQESGRYLSKFAKLMRLVLENMRTDYTSIEKEVDTLTYYLEMQKLRFNDIFDFKITTNGVDDGKSRALPTMILQPLVENAVEHGIRGIKKKGFISIDFTVKDDKWIITVEDNGSGYYPEKPEVSGKGKKHRSVSTKIIRERIEGFNKHSRNKEFRIKYENLSNEKTEGKGTRVIVVLPVIRMNN
jgi:ligand-binding sensor domain-containing protein